MPDNILFLQGPVGPFFKRLGKEFTAHGHNTFKINFNGGDALFYSNSESTNFVGTVEEWPNFLNEFIHKHQIKRIYLFGDCRKYHLLAKKVCANLSTEIHVFEEGYLRPNYLTLEKDGVNGNSKISRIADNYRQSDRNSLDEDQYSGSGFMYAAVFAILYYLAALVWRYKFPNYRHHRSMNVLIEGLYWIRGGIRKHVYSIGERKIRRRLTKQGSSDVFVAILQVHSDMQVKTHSSFDSIEEFINEIIRSFSQYASKDARLVLKHHPMDRGYTNYKGVISKLAKHYNTQDRIDYLHEINLPSLLKNAKGVVTINSTVGLSSLHHGTPIKNLGYAIYDIPGLTYQGGLPEFWKDTGSIDMDLYERFRAWLMRNNQIRGNFYRNFNRTYSVTGLRWPQLLEDTHLASLQKPKQMIRGKLVKPVTSVSSGV